MGGILVMGDDFEMVGAGGGGIPLYRLCIGVDVSKRFCLEILWHVKLKNFYCDNFWKKKFLCKQKTFFKYNSYWKWTFSKRFM